MTRFKNIFIILLLLHAYESATESCEKSITKASSSFSSDKENEILKLSITERKKMLFQSAEDGDLGLLKFIVQQGGIDINSQDRDGNTVLHLVSRAFKLSTATQVQIIRWLLKHNIDSRIKNKAGFTAFRIAVMSANTEVSVRIMTNLFQMHGENKIVQEEVRDESEISEDASSDFQKAIYFIQIGDVEQVRLYVNKEGMNLYQRDHYGRMLIHIAAQMGNLEIFKMIDEKMNNLTVIDDKDRNPWFIASNRTHIDIMRYLVEMRKINVDLKNKEGQRAIDMVSVKGGSGGFKVAEFLIQKDSEINGHDHSGITPLQWAAANNNLSIAELYLNSGANPNSHNISGITAIHLASGHGHDKMVSLLISYGANPKIEDKAGRRPFDWAEENRHTKVIEILKAYQPHNFVKWLRNKLR